MQEKRREYWGRIHYAGIALLMGLLAFFVPHANAAPFTDNFNTLITDLNSRVATLSGSTDKVQQKQLKTAQTALKTLQLKSSTSLATDIKNLGSVAKTLGKSFPDDTTFGTDLETALQGLIGEVLTGLGTAQTTLDGLGGTTCATKAQGTLDAASNLVVAASSATDFATASKLLGSGLKSALKAGVAAVKCTSGGGGGGGGGGGVFMKATISGDFSLNFDAVQLSITATYGGSGAGTTFSVVGGVAALGGTGMDITVLGVPITGPGTYPLFTGSNVFANSPGKDYLVTDGTITFTTFDLAGQRAAGTFHFTATAPGGSGTITVANGSFSVTKITIVQ